MLFDVSEQSSKFGFPTTIHYGTGIRKQVPKSLQRDHKSCPLIVTDRGVAQLPDFKEFCEFLEHSGLSPKVYSGIHGNPVESQVTDGVTAFKEGQCDSVVAIGGGAALDVAKVIALMANHPGHMFDYEDGKPDALPVDQEIPPIFAIPTTSGTGSEVGRASVVSDEKTKKKRIIFDPKLLPQEVYLDPELSIGLPPSITASTGLDALTHLIEAYVAVGFNPLTDAIALHGIRMISDHLVPAYEFSKVPDKKDKAQLESRGMMACAAMMGAVAFQKGLGVTHSCAHALSTVNDLHHGLANGILLPYCMKFNLQSVPQLFEQMAQATGQAQNGQEFIGWLVKLKEKLDVPKSLGDVGVEEKHIPELVANAFVDGCHQQNPRPCKEQDFVDLFTAAIRGEL